MCSISEHILSCALTNISCLVALSSIHRLSSPCFNHCTNWNELNLEVISSTSTGLIICLAASSAVPLAPLTVVIASTRVLALPGFFFMKLFNRAAGPNGDVYHTSCCIALSVRSTALPAFSMERMIRKFFEYSNASAISGINVLYVSGGTPTALATCVANAVSSIPSRTPLLMAPRKLSTT